MATLTVTWSTVGGEQQISQTFTVTAAKLGALLDAHREMAVEGQTDAEGNPVAQPSYDQIRRSLTRAWVKDMSEKAVWHINRKAEIAAYEAVAKEAIDATES